MKTVALVLSGCGVNDGSEITEAAGLIISLSQAGYDLRFYAPDRQQSDVVDHIHGRPTGERRNVLSESARIARGKIEPLSALKLQDADAVVIPGGFGAAKNLCDFAAQGVAAQLIPDARETLLPFLQARKPLVALCAAPLVLALLAQEAGFRGARLTFGHMEEGADLIQALKAWGQTHVESMVSEACIDSKRQLISVPAYMYGAATPADVFAACQAAVAALDDMLDAAEEAGA
jgi:enhancing lycopene biosynthesis protein 2